MTESRSPDIPQSRPSQGRLTYRSRHVSRMSVYIICFFICAGKLNRVEKRPACVCRLTEDGAVSWVMVKAPVLSQQSRGRSHVTGTTGQGHLVRETGLHAVDRDNTEEQCAGVDRWDAPCRSDGSSQKTDRGHSVGYASTNVSPNLCPRFPFIRSTRGSSYEEAWTIHFASRVDT